MIWAQLVGVVGICILIAVFQFNNRKIILRLQLVSGLVWALHYILLGAFTGAAMNALMSLRNYVFEKYRHNGWMFWISVAVIVMAGLLTWRDWSSVFPLIASIVATIAVWQKNPRHIRFLMIFVPILWFCYNYLNGSYPGMVGDTVTFVSLLVGMYRFDIRKHQDMTKPRVRSLAVSGKTRRG